MDDISQNSTPVGGNLSRVVGYVRDSGGQDQDASTLQQETEIRAACRDRGWVLTRVFQDAARPGSSVVGRDAFSEMIRYLRDGGQGEGAVVVWKYNRLARDLNDSQYYKADLRRRGIEVVSLMDQIPAGPDGRLIESVVDWMSQRFLSDLSADVKRGQAHAVRVYKAHPTPRSPAGYRRVPFSAGFRRDGSEHVLHRLEPDPATAPLVRRAYEMRADGKSYREIEHQVGLHLTKGGYRAIFRNQLYIGTYKWGDQTVPDFTEPLVDRDTWDRVQVVNDGWRSRKRHPRRESSAFLLAGIARCARCGSIMVGHSNRIRGKTYSYYRCNGTNEASVGCSARLVDARVLDGLVMAEIKRILVTPDLMAVVYKDYVESRAARVGEVQDRAAALERELTQVQGKIARITTAIAEHGHSQAMLDTLRNLEGQRDGITETLAGLVVPGPAKEIGEPDLAHFGEWAWQQIEQGDVRKQRGLIGEIVSEIKVERIESGVKGGMQVRYLPLVGEVDIFVSLG